MKPVIAVIILVSVFVTCLAFWVAPKFTPSTRTIAVILAVSSASTLGFVFFAPVPRDMVSLGVIGCVGLVAAYPLWRMHKRTLAE